MTTWCGEGHSKRSKQLMGHEMGHYVLNHIPKDMLLFFVVIVIAFAYLR
jgi:STE24 endopeptidase